VRREGADVITLTCLLRRLPELSHEEFVRYHRERHAPLVSGLPEARRYMRRYAIEHPDPANLPGVPATTFDAVVRVSFDSLDDLRGLFESPGYQTVIRPDEQRFLDFTASEFYLTEEWVVIGEPLSHSPGGASPSDSG